MKIREHRGRLEDSMKTVAEIEPTLEAVTAHVNDRLKPWGPVSPERIAVRPYGGFDARIGWDTYIVVLEGYGPFGFTDGPLIPSFVNYQKPGH